MGTSSAKSTFVTEPGVRVTNTQGNIGFKHSHALYWYKNLSAADYGYTGTLQRFLAD